MWLFIWVVVGGAGIGEQVTFLCWILMLRKAGVCVLLLRSMDIHHLLHQIQKWEMTFMNDPSQEAANQNSRFCMCRHIWLLLNWINFDSLEYSQMCAFMKLRKAVKTCGMRDMWATWIHNWTSLAVKWCIRDKGCLVQLMQFEKKQENIGKGYIVIANGCFWEKNFRVLLFCLVKKFCIFDKKQTI